MAQDVTNKKDGGAWYKIFREAFDAVKDAANNANSQGVRGTERIERTPSIDLNNLPTQRPDNGVIDTVPGDWGTIRGVQDRMKEMQDRANRLNWPPDDDVIEYTYKPGDTFGQVLLNLGLSDGKNLWGKGGDVEYYRQQLYDQGIYGNVVPVGRTIRLRRRK